jgi:predicted nucleic acid-binding protein
VEPDDVADQLDDLHTVLGPPLVMTADWLRHAAALARIHALSFYDASWAATAIALRMPLVSADTRLLAAGLAESPRDIVTRLKLPPHEPPATPEEPRRGARRP